MEKQNTIKDQLVKKLPISIGILTVLFILTVEWVYVRKYQKAEQNSKFWAQRYWSQVDSTAYYHRKYDSMVNSMGMGSWRSIDMDLIQRIHNYFMEITAFKYSKVEIITTHK